MNLKLIKNTDESKIIAHKIARLVHAETNASSLTAVEALTSMIANRCAATRQNPRQVIENRDIFESQSADSQPSQNRTDKSDERGFQMCLRTAQRMLNGNLPDSCCGAIRFHRSDTLPEWAVARGYIAEIDGLLFYL